MFINGQDISTKRGRTRQREFDNVKEGWKKVHFCATIKPDDDGAVKYPKEKRSSGGPLRW